MRHAQRCLAAAWLFACAAGPARAFEYFEHRYLGNVAYASALKNADANVAQAVEAAARAELGFGRKPVGERPRARRSLTQLPIQFGDLSALAGDLSDSPEDLAKLLKSIVNQLSVPKAGFDSRAQALIIDTRLQWFSACKWVYRLRLRNVQGEDWAGCFDHLPAGAAPPNSMFGAEGYRPSRDELATHEMVPKYIALASDNVDHFPRYSWAAYVKAHQKALDSADRYRKPPEGSKDDPAAVLAEMLLHEAFAQHFLQDSFASGHIGTEFSQCRGKYFFCRPTKRRMQQTHDSLNELGVPVRIQDPDRARELLGAMDATAISGWTAFGDNHLFIPEADFHRALLVLVATRSLEEVFERVGNGPGPCKMCDRAIFPVPVVGGVSPDKKLTDADYPLGSLVEFESDYSRSERRSQDPRVPDLPVEGWKVTAGIARQWRGKFEGHVPSDSGFLLKVDYMRVATTGWPNALGFEYWNLPNRDSSYLFTAGWSSPRELTAFSWAIKGKFGWRTEENFTQANPSSERRGGIQVTFPAIEGVYEVYRPFALVGQVSLASFIFRHGTYQSEYALHKASAFFGARIDLSGI